MTNTNSAIDKFYYFTSKLRSIRNHKDNLFCTLFNEEKQGLLDLYNVLNGTKYTDINDLKIVTIKSALYITYRDDVAYLLNGTINLYEHQSTINPNMPVRFLIYLATEYQKIVEDRNNNIYGSKLVSLPTPKCVVFYNGDEECEDSFLLRLSNAFENKDIDADAELTVTVFNINKDHNKNIMNDCPTLAGYVHLIDKISRYKLTMPLRKAIDRAIDECIKEGHLEDFLRRHRAEVLGMLIFNEDKKKYLQAVREDAIESAHAELISENNRLKNEVLELRQEIESLKCSK